MPINFSGMTALLGVFDMPASVAFYRDVIGFDIVMQSRPGEHFDWVWLRRGRAELMLNTNFESHQTPASRDSARDRWHADVTLYFDCEDLDAAYDYLRSNGVAAEQPIVRPYGMRQLHLLDPDGYGLCFQHPVHDPKQSGPS